VSRHCPPEYTPRRPTETTLYGLVHDVRSVGQIEDRMGSARAAEARSASNRPTLHVILIE
jgi:hypothetical protein